MIINELKLQNFISHKKTSIELEHGIGVFIGENGTGKSSILDSIYFALFKESTRGSLDKLINDDTDNMEINLKFTSGGKLYEVNRKKRREGKSEALLRDLTNNISIDRTISGVGREIEDLIGLNKELFKSAIYIQQGEIDTLLDKGKTYERKKLISKLLGLESFETAYNEMKEIIDHFQSKADYIDAEIQILPQIEQDMKENNKRIGKTRMKIKGLSKLLDNISNKLEEEREIEKIWEEKVLKFTQWGTDIKQLKKNLKAYEKEIENKGKELEEIIRREESLEKIKTETKYFEPLKSAKSLIYDLEKVQIILKNFSANLKDIEKSEKQIKSNKKGFQEYKSCEEKLQKLNKAYSKLQESKGEYDTLGKQLEKVQEKQEEDEKRINNIFREIKEKQIGIKFFNDRIVEEIEGILKKKSSLLKKLRKDISNTEKEIGENEGIVKEIKANIESIESAEDICPLCNSKLTFDHKNQILQEQNQKIESLREKLKNLEDKQCQLAEEERKEKEISDFLKDKANPKILQNILKAIEENKETIEKNTHRISDLEQDMENINEMEEELTIHKQNLKTYKESYEAYISAQDALKSKDKVGLVEQKIREEEKSNKKEEELNTILEEISIERANVKDELRKVEKKKQKEITLTAEVKKRNQILGELEEKKKQLKKDKEEKDQFEKKLEELEYNKKDHDHFKAQLKELEEEYTTIKGDLEGEKARLEELGTTAKDLEKKQSALCKKKEELNRLEKYVSFLKIIRGHFSKDGIQNILRKRYIPRIVHYTRKLFQDFNMGFTDIQLTDDYNIILTKPNGTQSDIEAISGGERIAAALSVRLGIAKAIAGEQLELIMLDEPTIHLDQQHRFDLIDIIMQMRSIPQVIVVTHEEEMKDAADKLYIVKKTDGVSKVTTSISE